MLSGRPWVCEDVSIIVCFIYFPQIVISATVGKSYAGDIAIDDIRFFSGSCDGSSIDLKKLAKKREADSAGKQ